MCISILTITTRVSAKNTMAKLTSSGFFIIVLGLAILGSLIYLSHLANYSIVNAFAATENSTSNETSFNDNNTNSTANFTALMPSNFSTRPMNNTNATTTSTAGSNLNFS